MDYPKTKEDVLEFLLHSDIEFSVAQKLFDEDVDGTAFIEVTDSDLKELGLKLGPRKKILKVIQSIKNKEIDNDVNRRNPPHIHNFSLECPKSTEPLVMLTEGPSTSTESTPIPIQYSEPIDMDQRSSPSLQNFSFECPRSTEPFIVLTEEPSTSSDSKTCQYFDPDEINVTEMLLQCKKGKQIASKLRNKAVISRTDISEIVRIAVSAMSEDLKTLYPTTDQKINLAKAIVRDIPALKSERPGVEGYEHLFCPTTREGAIDWRLKTLRLALPPSKKKRRIRELSAKNAKKGPGHSIANKETDVTDFIISDDMKNKINWLKHEDCTDANKPKIFEMMKATFEVRRLFIKSGPPVTAIIEAYPKFKEYSGALIDAEFQLLYPKADSLLERFQSFYKPRIQLYVQEKRFNIVERVGKVHDENLCALLYLADLLPISGVKRKKVEGDVVRCTSQALLTFAGADSTVQDIIIKRQCQQPYLITTNKEDKAKSYFLVLDKVFFNVGSCSIKAFDILYKSHYVFNIQFQKQLLLLYNFMDHIIYKISHGSARSVVENMNNLLTNIQC